MSAHQAKTNPLVGVVLGVVAGWLSMVIVSSAGGRLMRDRMMRLNGDLDRAVPLVLILVVAAFALGALLALPSLTAGGLVGLRRAVAGCAMVLLPPRQAFDLGRAIQLPGSKQQFGYFQWDGSLVFFGLFLLVLGVRHWVEDLRRLREAGPAGPAAVGQYPPQPGQVPPPSQTRPNQTGPHQTGPGQWQHPGQPQHIGQPPYPTQTSHPGQAPYPGQTPYPGQPPYRGQAPYPGRPPYANQPSQPGHGPGQQSEPDRNQDWPQDH